MSCIFLTVGISGSGKSTFVKLKKAEFGLLELNAVDIRLHDYGNINDQTHNKEVFKKIDTLLESSNANVILSNTNLDLGRIITLANNHKRDTIILYIMLDSNNLQLCDLRIKKSLQRGDIRSNVPIEILKKQHDKFKKFMKEIQEVELPKNVIGFFVNSSFEVERV